MSEDARYRTSTQYRHWSYTPSALHALRKSTNELAAIRVRAAVRRVREVRAASSAENSQTENGRSNSAVPLDGEVECLTVEEELKLLTHFCRQLLDMGEFMGIPTGVKATATQYLKRFYLTNSIMTYEPKSILKTALFFATKTDNHYTPLAKFVTEIGKTTPEEILASEFLLTQGLRFMFDIRHPFRGLEGTILKLIEMARGRISIETGDGGAMPGGPGAVDRIQKAHGKAREFLKLNAQLTDVYFLYTPSQITFASLLLADLELTTWYLHLKFSEAPAMGEKVLQTVRKCANMLKEVKNETTPEERKELQGLSKKLRRCMNPEKMDLVGLQRKKREGTEGGDGDRDGDGDGAARKRRRERERGEREGEDVFGPIMGRG